MNRKSDPRTLSVQIRWLHQAILAPDYSNKARSVTNYGTNGQGCFTRQAAGLHLSL